MYYIIERVKTKTSFAYRLLFLQYSYSLSFISMTSPVIHASRTFKKTQHLTTSKEVLLDAVNRLKAAYGNVKEAKIKYKLSTIQRWRYNGQMHFIAKITPAVLEKPNPLGHYDWREFRLDLNGNTHFRITTTSLLNYGPTYHQQSPKSRFNSRREAIGRLKEVFYKPKIIE